MYEVLVGLPGVLGVNRCFCLRHLGGSKGRSYIIVANIRFGAEQIIFKQKTAIMGCLVILNRFTFKLLWLERDLAVEKCWFQKCVPRGGYRAYSWTELRSGALLECDSRPICRDLRLFGGEMVMLEIFGTFRL